MRKLRLNEQQFLRAVRLIVEDKRGDTAKALSMQFLRQFFSTWPMFQVPGHRLDDIFKHKDNPDKLTYIDYMFKCFEEIFYHDPKLRASQIMRLEPAFIKIAFDNGFQQGNQNSKILNRLRRIEWKMYYMCKSDKQEANFITKITDLSTFTFDFLNNRYGPLIDQEDAEEEERINTTQFEQKGDYKIVGPIDFRIANMLGNYTGKAYESYLMNNRDRKIYKKKRKTFIDKELKKAGLEPTFKNKLAMAKKFIKFKDWCKDQAESSKMCYTQFTATWEDYADADLSHHLQNNNVYVILRDGWQRIPAAHDDGGYSAYDTYGLSMIWVIVDDEGGIQYCNTRWNHAADYAEGKTVDFALNREEISNIIGRNFMESFKGKNDNPEPYHEVDIEALLERMDNGEEGETENSGTYQTTTDPAVVEACLNVIRGYFRRVNPRFNVDAIFNNSDNFYNLSILEYIFWQFERAFYDGEELKNSDFGKHSEPIFLRIALENRFQQVDEPDDNIINVWNRIEKFIFYLYTLSSGEDDEADFALNLPENISLGELEEMFGEEVDAEEWGNRN